MSNYEQIKKELIPNGQNYRHNGKTSVMWNDSERIRLKEFWLEYEPIFERHSKLERLDKVIDQAKRSQVS